MKIKIKLTNPEMLAFSQIVKMAAEHLPAALEDLENLQQKSKCSLDILQVCSFIHKNKTKLLFIEPKKLHSITLYIGDAAAILSFCINYDISAADLVLRNSIINKIYRPLISFSPQFKNYENTNILPA